MPLHPPARFYGSKPVDSLVPVGMHDAASLAGQRKQAVRVIHTARSKT